MFPSTDSAPNIRLAVDLFKCVKVPCVAHTLHTTVSTAFSKSSVDIIVEKVRQINTYFKQCTTAKADLMDLQTKDPEVETILSLTQGIKTRWNSDHAMIKRFLSLKTKLAPIVTKYPFCPSMPSNVNMRILSFVVEILNPLVEFSTDIGSESEVTSSIVIPLKNKLKRYWGSLKYTPCEDLQDEENAENQMHYESLVCCLTAQFTRYLDPLESIGEFAIATFLDPRFKSDHFTNKQLPGWV